jgi:HEAT repeat protein
MGLQHCAFASEVAKFRQWAGSLQERFAEWECNYPNWLEFYTAAEVFLNTSQDRQLTTDELELLLYALARDNESEHILALLEREPKIAMQVAVAALTYGEPDARWQAAVLLGGMATVDAKALLYNFFDDNVEYVRRRALLAAAKNAPAMAETVASKWISSPDDYSRLAALTVLDDLQSPRLEAALAQLRDDPFVYVREKVIEIEQLSATQTQPRHNDRV